MSHYTLFTVKITGVAVDGVWLLPDTRRLHPKLSGAGDREVGGWRDFYPTPHPRHPTPMSFPFPGVHSVGVPPVPIPNTAVKTDYADNTRGANPRKDR